LGASYAQDIELTSRDGTFTLEGTLVSFDGEFYRIDTVYGPLTVDGMGVTCAGPGCPDLEAYVAEVSLSGAEAMGAVLVPALIEAFAAQRGLSAERRVEGERAFTYTISDGGGRTLARFAFRLSTTEAGLAGLIGGSTDIAMAAREATPEEIAAAEAAGLGMLSAPAQSRVVAFDAFVVAVAPENPAREIPLDLLGPVLSGGIADWGALGGVSGQPIRLHALGAELGAQQAIEDVLLGPGGLVFAESAVRHADAGALADAVAGDPWGIGITFRSSLGSARALPLAGGCGFTLSPDDAAVRSEDYPLVAPMFLYLPNTRLPAVARDFLAFLSSPAAERVIGRAGFTDLGARRVPLSEQGDRIAKAVLGAGAEIPLSVLQEMLVSLRGAERLSPTFRFRAGAAGLDAPSRGNALLLSEAIEAGVYDGRELIFVGFSDGEGGADANLRIAMTRSETVMAAVRALSEMADFRRVKLSALAFGEAMPMACEDTEWGRRVNRRVEVWVR
jgi:phosphate transport system substrate-binding protein